MQQRRIKLQPPAHEQAVDGWEVPSIEELFIRHEPTRIDERNRRSGGATKSIDLNMLNFATDIECEFIPSFRVVEQHAEHQ